MDMRMMVGDMDESQLALVAACWGQTSFGNGFIDCTVENAEEEELAWDAVAIVDGGTIVLHGRTAPGGEGERKTVVLQPHHVVVISPWVQSECHI